MLNLKFFKNSSGVYVGDIYKDTRRLLATTHPATIAAAIVAISESELTVHMRKKSVRVGFPLSESDAAALDTESDDEDMAHFLRGFVTFSHLISFPQIFDDQAEIHFRTAVHHLPPELVIVEPEGPPPSDFKRQLKNRNQYIYFPDC